MEYLSFVPATDILFRGMPSNLETCLRNHVKAGSSQISGIPRMKIEILELQAYFDFLFF